MLKATGKRITLEEITHGFAVPDGFEAHLRRVDSGSNPQVEWHIIHKATGEKAGELNRDFGRTPDGKPFVHHAYMWLDEKYQKGHAISDTINGNALRHYEKWGIAEANISAARVGRYAWARLGFNFDDDEIGRFKSGFNRYIKRTPALKGRENELTQAFNKLVHEPWKLAKWDIGVKLQDENAQAYPRRNAAGVPLPAEDVNLGKAFLLSRDVSMWEGKLRIDRKNEGYQNAVAKSAVAGPRKKE